MLENISLNTMKPIRITQKEIPKLAQEIKSGSDDAVGSYLYKKLRIQVSKYRLSTSERVLQLYHRRRKQGLCVQCGKKVTKINPRTKKLYRLCEYHRKKVDKIKA